MNSLAEPGRASQAHHERHPVRQLLLRYLAVLRAAWVMRRQLAAPQRTPDEIAFLPEALRLKDSPPHPAPRCLALAIGVLLLLSLLWACLGQIDIVAVAPGRIVVGERTKTLQPLQAAVVRRVRVKDGDPVQRGQVLVELDPTEAMADSASVQERLDTAIREQARAAALSLALRSGRAPSATATTTGATTATGAAIAVPPADGGLVVPANPEAGAAQAQVQAQAQLQAEWQDMAARLAKLGAEQARRQAEVATVQAAVAKLEATLPIARQRETDFQQLVSQGFVAGHAGQDRHRERIEMERDLVLQQAQLAEARAALDEGLQARAAYLADTQRQLSERLSQALLQRQQLGQELSKARQRSQLTRLTAPVSGTVQQVAVHTEGGVVTPAQVLMVIVPSDAPVTAEVLVDNKDIGFVRAGQAVVVKLETFPFTRYGTVPATIQSVAADAVPHEQRGAVFPAILSLDSRHIEVDGRRIRLSPGMNLSAEVQTGRRRVIDYLLSPVKQAGSESFRER